MMLIPELEEGAKYPPIRLPGTGNLPTTARLRRIIDTAPLQRLRGVKQLGLAHLVYPGAVHTRFEHSLGVYAMARRLVSHLSSSPRAAHLLDQEQQSLFLVTALLHDVGHYPFSHTLEELPPDDTGRVELMKHDARARSVILNDPVLPKLLMDEWGISPEQVARIIDEGLEVTTPKERRLRTMLSGPLNPDRLDYLLRDSAHVGVPYGSVIDIDRLLLAIGFTDDGERLGITRKGVSAVETLIFASYLMYREVYWHHTVRAAQAMLKRAATAALQSGEIHQTELLDLNDAQAIALLDRCTHPVTRSLVKRLTGAGREFYRRVFTVNLSQRPDGELFDRIANSHYWELEALAEEICAGLSKRLGIDVPAHSLLIDVAGRGKELFFAVPVLDPVGTAIDTGDPAVSLVAPYLSQNFELHAKQVQLLAPAEWVQDVRRYLGLREDDD